MRNLALLFALAACTRAPSDGPVAIDPSPEETSTVTDPSTTSHPLPTGRTRSGELVPATSTHIPNSPMQMLVLDKDNGDLLQMPDPTGVVRAIPVGAEPTRMIRDGADLYVTLRASGELVHLRSDGLTWAEVTRRQVGAEPFDVGLSLDGGTLYVTLSMENALVALDRSTLVETSRWAMSNEPRWLAVAPDDGRVYVGSFFGGLLFTVNPTDGVVERTRLPEVRKSDDETCRSAYLRPRITSEIVVDGTHVYVPTMYADTDLRPPPDSNHSETDHPANTEGDTGFVPFSVDDEELPWCPAPPPIGRPTTTLEYYGPPTPLERAGQVSRFNPALVLVPRDGSEIEATVVADIVRIDRRDGDHPRNVVARSYLSGLEIEGGADEDKWRAYVTMEAMGTVVAVNLHEEVREDFTGGFKSHARAAGATESGTSGVRAVEGDVPSLLLWSWFDRSIEAYDRRSIGQQMAIAGGDLGYGSNLDAAPPSELSAEVARGRELFYRSDLLGMTNMSSGVSCAGCHADGRTDGNTWLFADFARQTPSLAGDIAHTAPVTWLGDVGTIAEEAEFTTINRMGGRGVPPEDYQALEAFVRTLRGVVLPPPADPALVEEGREVFHRPQVGCAACHSGEYGTSNANVPLYGYERLNIPPLRGVAATAPYLHDGSAATLRAVIERSRDGSMGNTSSLTPREMDALEAYLKQL